MQRRGLLGLGLATVLAALSGPSLPSWSRCATRAQSEIFSGVTYGCSLLEPNSEGRGVLHWVRIDLTAPGIELYITPLDPSAVQQGWQYRLRWIDDVVKHEKLAVAINGTMFDSASDWRIRLPGDLAQTVEMVVADHVPAFGRFWRADYLLWFDKSLTPSVTASRPPSQRAIEEAKWGISGGTLGLHNGEVRPEADRRRDARTAVGIDHDRKLLFFAVANDLSPHRLFVELAHLGARDGILLDGGGSTAMAIGEHAAIRATGALLGGLRPVATYLGVRALRLGR